MYKSDFLKNLNEKRNNNPFFHLTGDKDEKSYIRDNGCTYKKRVVYGGSIVTIKDKKTKEIIELHIF